MHGNDMGRMVDVNRKFRRRILGQFFADLVLVPNQDDLGPVILRSEIRSLDDGLRSEIASHGVHCDLHLTLSVPVFSPFYVSSSMETTSLPL